MRPFRGPAGMKQWAVTIESGEAGKRGGPAL